MRDHPAQTGISDSVPRCEYILLVATSSELKQLKDAAHRLSLKFERKKLVDRGDYYDLGRIAGEDSSHVIALRVDMGAHGFGGSASKAIHFRGASGAQSIICVGMAFGISPTTQRVGDVLVSTGLLPYDDRTVRCEDGRQHHYVYERVRTHSSKESLMRLFERHRDELTEQQHAVHFGVMLSGSSRIQCAGYRDVLVRDTAAAAARNEGSELLPVVVGGEMEGIGLLSTSSPDNPSWIIVKGISDFADGEGKEHLPARRNLACANAAEFVLRALVREEKVVGGAT